MATPGEDLVPCPRCPNGHPTACYLCRGSDGKRTGFVSRLLLTMYELASIKPYSVNHALPPEQEQLIQELRRRARKAVFHDS